MGRRVFWWFRSFEGKSSPHLQGSCSPRRSAIGYWLLITGESIWIVFQSVTLQVSRSFEESGTSHRTTQRHAAVETSNLVPLSVLVILEEVLNSQHLHSAKQAKFISSANFLSKRGKIAEQNQTSAIGNT